MSILFINGSPDSKVTTASLAATLLTGKEYETVRLPEHRIYPYGSTLEGDEFDWVLDRMKAADTIVIGSPVYWHNICGAVRNLLDRFYGRVTTGELSGRKLAFLYNLKTTFHSWNTDYYYKNILTRDHGKASECFKCGKCEKICPRHLPIRKLLEQVAEEFEKE